ncbi:hypothetical protein V6N12_032277 [Hibiscus sabdariffa]|uniref:Uncharacterized protein n=1 Tax=Hibiscus sabdariffa TaxID=183260 RepID=A0ABR2CCM1_9ROSI
MMMARKKKKVVPQSLNQSRAEGIEERNVAIESQKLEEAGKAAVNGNNGGCKKISGFVDNETLWMLDLKGNNSRSTSQKLEKISNSAIAPEKDICINGNEDLQNSHLWASEPASPVSRGPSWVEVVEKTMDLAHVEQPGDNVVASQNPIQERRKRDKVVSEVERRKRASGFGFDGVATVGRCFVAASLAWLLSNVHLVWLSFGWSLYYVGAVGSYDGF